MAKGKEQMEEEAVPAMSMTRDGKMVSWGARPEPREWRVSERNPVIARHNVLRALWSCQQIKERAERAAELMIRK